MGIDGLIGCVRRSDGGNQGMGGCGWSSVLRCGACGGGASLLGAKPRPHVMWAPAGSGGASVAEGDMFLFQETLLENDLLVPVAERVSAGLCGRH